MLRNTEIFKASMCGIYGGNLAVGQFFFLITLGFIVSITLHSPVIDVT